VIPTNTITLENWDSVNVLTYMAFVDEKFAREIIPDEIEKARTVEDLYRIASGKAGSTTS